MMEGMEGEDLLNGKLDKEPLQLQILELQGVLFLFSQSGHP